MESIEARLSTLECESAEMRDRLEIYQKTAAYGPLVDSGDSRGAAALWSRDGTYDWGKGLTDQSRIAAYGRDELEAVFDAEEHRSIIRNGSAHWLSLPQIAVNGDRAQSLCYSCLMMRASEDFTLARVSVCYFEWERQGGQWTIVRRRNRLLDGSAGSGDLLAEGVAGLERPPT
jgi:hypothetical protein